MTALLIAPDRALADQFIQTASRTRALQIVGDLKVYPSQQTLDIRVRQLRPDVVLLDVATNLDTAGDLIRFLSTQNPPVHVIGLHTSNNSEAILRTLRYGASEFLYAPFDVSIQEAAISRIQRLLVPDPGSDREAGKIVVFASAKPGSGASTLALQTAFALRRGARKRILLIDFDLTGGTLGFSLKLNTPLTILDALQHADRLDAQVWSTLVVNAGGVDVLAAPETPYTNAVEPDRLHDLLQWARLIYDWVVVDLPSIFHRASLLAVSESDQAFVVSTAELASLHLARKGVKLLSHVGFEPARYQVLVNRVNRNEGLNGSDLGKIFECSVDTSLPNDFFALHRVVTLGEPLEPDSELGRAIDGLAGKLRGVVEEKKRPAGFFSARPVFSQT
jgi:Flp pilus assembly protein, ATPase CpaE